MQLSLMSPVPVSSIVVTSKLPWRLQALIGSISVTITRAPKPRNESRSLFRLARTETTRLCLRSSRRGPLLNVRERFAAAVKVV